MLRRPWLCTMLIGLMTTAGAGPGRAQDNLDEGKSAKELFRTNCAICHRSVRGLGRSMGSWTLSGFLTEHYTTGRSAANTLANYLIAVGKPEREARPQRRRTRDTRSRRRQ